MKKEISREAHRIMRVYVQGEIQLRESVLRRATDLPSDTLRTWLNILVRENLLTVRSVSAGGGSWENLFTLTTEGRGVVEQMSTRKRTEIRYRI
jgi:DNA-binding PadR family transcriptional regulator